MYLLHIHSSNGMVMTVTFHSAFARTLAMIPLAAQPVTLTIEDVQVAA